MTTDLPFSGQDFRDVLGSFPTGVVIVTSIDESGSPVGMAVSAFNSVSLDPPLVAFFPKKNSETLPGLRSNGSFCVNILSAEQQSICRVFASKGMNRFADIDWSPAGSGSPLLDGVVGWIDCDVESVTEAGDHYVVLGRVRDLGGGEHALPLVYFLGGYGHFSPFAVTAPPQADLVGSLRYVDLARPALEALSNDLELPVIVGAVVRDDVAVLASIGSPEFIEVPTRAGQRMPFIPPIGAGLIAWEDDQAIENWLRRDSRQDSRVERADYREALERVRSRGWSLGLGSAAHHQFERALLYMARDPEASHLAEELQRSIDQLGGEYEPAELVDGVDYSVRNISAPVFGADGRPLFTFTVYGMRGTQTAEGIQRLSERLLEATKAATTAVGGQWREPTSRLGDGQKRAG